ncbi:hypothetical protein BAUCODRAFT_575649 [Baudoinia panamericana UAMH 10762]|uniref:MSP domain-containing protein n=1 Tax=Baudoinia panamericana (strain UAMH 10762) TaxID=717646 RepID=M2NF80_BAUPA|nr:uncharacterized protein BAUCODRAFT_575649 [Baudoinia panamericana UAMH 10762]EMC97635.1 hypothetical protein BAUCODRAFT_575649 [Baudoinia panamericana UAMH 10762]
MSVDLEPAELGFKRPFNHEVSQVLRLHNPSSDPVAFKVKTTAPKQYCVRPNSGRIEAGRAVEVQVLLQAMKEDPPPDARCRDKFLVQTVTVPSDREFTTVTQIWSTVEQSAKSSIQEKKIRVNFLPAEGTVGPAVTTNGIASSQHHDEEPPAYSSPVSTMTPQRDFKPSGPISTPSDKPAGATHRGEAVDSAHNPAMSQTSIQSTTSAMSNQLSSTAAAITSAIPTSQADLQKQLDAANAQIKSLQQQATEGLRQRNIISGDEKKAADGSSSTTTTSLQNRPAPGGVPVQYVALLCLVCFLLAYFLF